MNLNQEQRRVCRELAGLGPYDHPPVEIVSGSDAPRVRGRRYWSTHFVKRYPSGKVFARRLYTPSTRRVEVGEKWARRVFGREVPVLSPAPHPRREIDRG